MSSVPQIRIPATYMCVGTSKKGIVCRSERPGHDVDYLFGQVGIDRSFVNWSGNCGHLTTAIPGTIVNMAAGGGNQISVRFSHPSGNLRIGAETRETDGEWWVEKVVMVILLF